MEINAALLADFAQVRDGMLFVVSGGITRIIRDEFPSPLGLYVALMVELSPIDFPRAHEIDVTVQSIDGESLAQAKGGFAVGADAATVARLDPGESVQVPVVVPLAHVALPRGGAYSVDILLDGSVSKHLAIKVVPSTQWPGKQS